MAYVRERRGLAERIRAEGQATAERFAWPRIIEALEVTWDAAARLGK